MQSYESFGILFSVMSEQSYLKAPSSANARVDIAGVEGSLEFISGNIGTSEWCTLEDIKRLVDEAHKTLEGARQELRDAEAVAYRMGASKVIEKVDPKSLSTKHLAPRRGPAQRPKPLIVNRFTTLNFKIIKKSSPL